jgi:hypothetical protein
MNKCSVLLHFTPFFSRLSIFVGMPRFTSNYQASKVIFAVQLPGYCGEHAISLHSLTVSLSSGSTLCFQLWGTWVQYPGGYLCETGILLLELSRYIGDPDVIDHCGLVWCGLRPELSLCYRADNVIIPLDLTQLFCPSFTLGCWGGALWRAYNLTAFPHTVSLV